MATVLARVREDLIDLPSSLPPPVRDRYVLFLPYVGSLNGGGSLNTRWGMPTAGLPLGVGGRCPGAQVP